MVRNNEMTEYDLHTQGANHKFADAYDGRETDRNRAPSAANYSRDEMSDPTVVVTEVSVTLGKISVKHNEIPWRTATNRHTTEYGRSWGWIDGAPGNVCWENGTAFNQQAASSIVRAHNQWLEDQQPLSIKIIKAEREHAAALANFKETEAKNIAAASTLEAAAKTLEALVLLRAQEAS